MGRTLFSAGATLSASLLVLVSGVVHLAVESLEPEQPILDIVMVIVLRSCALALGWFSSMVVELGAPIGLIGAAARGVLGQDPAIPDTAPAVGRCTTSGTWKSPPQSERHQQQPQLFLTGAGRQFARVVGPRERSRDGRAGGGRRPEEFGQLVAGHLFRVRGLHGLVEAGRSMLAGGVPLPPWTCNLTMGVQAARWSSSVGDH